MVRERVGDWRLAWRFALAGLIAGILVTAFGYVGVTNRSFDAAQDQLFPAPSPDPRITLVAIDQKSNDRLGNYPWLNSYHAKVIDYLASLHPKVILFDIVLDHDTGFDPETPTDNTDADLTSAPLTISPGPSSQTSPQPSATAALPPPTLLIRSEEWRSIPPRPVFRTKRRSPLSCKP